MKDFTYFEFCGMQNLRDALDVDVRLLYRADATASMSTVYAQLLSGKVGEELEQPLKDKSLQAAIDLFCSPGVASIPDRYRFYTECLDVVSQRLGGKALTEELYHIKGKMATGSYMEMQTQIPMKGRRLYTYAAISAAEAFATASVMDAPRPDEMSALHKKAALFYAKRAAMFIELPDIHENRNPMLDARKACAFEQLADIEKALKAMPEEKDWKATIFELAMNKELMTQIDILRKFPNPFET